MSFELKTFFPSHRQETYSNNAKSSFEFKILPYASFKNQAPSLKVFIFQQINPF